MLLIIIIEIKGNNMEQIFEELNKNSLTLKGKIVDICEVLKYDAKEYRGITVGQYLRLRKLQKAEEKQFGYNIWS